MQTVDRAHDVILANNKTFAERFAAGDGAAVAALYTADAHLFPPGMGAIAGREGIGGFWNAAIGMGLAGVELTTGEVIELGEMASECGTFKLFTPDGAVFDHGKYLVVWKLDDGEWRLHRDIWNTSKEG